MNRVIRALLSCLLVWTAVVSAAPTFPALSGRVVDEANLMSRKQAHQLTQQLAAFEKRSGIQLVVVSIHRHAGRRHHRGVRLSARPSLGDRPEGQGQRGAAADRPG